MDTADPASSPQRKYTARELCPDVYDRLRQRAARFMAGERADHSLQATALLHEGILRLGGFDEPLWESKWHFLGAAYRAMKRELIEHARHKGAEKAGGKLHRHDVQALDVADSAARDDVAALLESVERLGREEPESAHLVNLVYIVGFTVQEAADELGFSKETAKRRLRFAKAWLGRDLGDWAPDAE
ncbi:MAG: ECF-type sigma factor [Planctomycetota bacterium]